MAKYNIGFPAYIYTQITADTCDDAIRIARAIIGSIEDKYGGINLQLPNELTEKQNGHIYLDTKNVIESVRLLS